YYPAGWEATIDGKPAEIHKTNFVLRGLEVPAGEHTVQLIFEPTSNIWGGRIAWAGHIVLYILGITIVVQSFRKQDQA
ncbi:MAG: YfhO family protein, partial [Aliifodinibius sp.]|nr:YfhO family protein [Fodinibius sp.]NIV13057.1 YfhO family protein [Fodinibius sp.]NIY26720.1 YfhO family protein [Fodinibius sp.]